MNIFISIFGTLMLFSVSNAQTRYVEFDKVGNGYVVREEKLIERDLTFLCPASRVKTSNACLEAAKVSLGPSCAFETPKNEKTCVRRTIRENNPRAAKPVSIDEWWCSVKSSNCKTSRTTCGEKISQVTPNRSPQVSFYFKVCSAATDTTRRRTRPLDDSRNIR